MKQRNPASIDLEASSLLPKFHNVGRCFTLQEDQKSQLSLNIWPLMGQWVLETAASPSSTWPQKLDLMCWKEKKKKDPEQGGWDRRWKELADGMNMIKNKLKSDENTT